MIVTQGPLPGPWPGPRPYREVDQDRFFGRDDERYELLERLDAERLMLLTAPTAVGKTSFLRASVVPELRRRRRRALERDDPSLAPAVLVVRDWPIPGVATTDQFLIDAVKAGIEDLEEQQATYVEWSELLQQDHARLFTVAEETGEGSALGFITALAQAAGGLTLILDQFEEALQGGGRHVRDLSQLIGRLYRTVPDVRLLLSFRQEFLGSFNQIGRLVGDLGKITYVLPPLDETAVREALHESARVGGVSLEEAALDELLHWMVVADVNIPNAAGRAPTSRRVGQVAADTPIRLLSLQALLLQLYEVAAATTPDGAISISVDTLNQLRAESDDDGAALVESALRRFINSLLPLPAGLTDPSGLPADRTLDNQEEQLMRLRRSAARMAPSLTSGGFKVQQEQSALLSRAWREEWEVIDIAVDDVEEHLEEWLQAISQLEEDDESRFDPLFLNILEDTSEDEDAPQDISPLSGAALRNGWSIRATGVDLIRTSLISLELLREGNVLRRRARLGHVTYELVHDGFGDAIFSWAEETRAEPLDALSATTAERGTAFRWSRLTGRIPNACWRGCWIGPDPARGPRLLIEDATFDDCDLRGTVFNRCDFRGGRFQNCNLSGAVFWDCTFEGTPEAPFIFDGVAASGLSFEDASSLRHVRFTGDSRLHNLAWTSVTIDNVTVDGCTVNQMTLGDVTLTGRLEMTGSWILLSDLTGLRTADATVEELLDIRECDLFYCRLDEPAGRAVGREDSNRRFPSPKDIGDEPPLRGAESGRDPWRQPN